MNTKPTLTRLAAASRYFFFPPFLTVWRYVVDGLFLTVVVLTKRPVLADLLTLRVGMVMWVV